MNDWKRPSWFGLAMLLCLLTCARSGPGGWPSGPGEQIGTGVGARKDANFQLVKAEFEQTPRFIVNILYKRRDYLVRTGIINHPIEAYYRKLAGAERAFEREFAGNVTAAEPSDVDERVRELADYFSERLKQARVKRVSLMDFPYTRDPEQAPVVSTIGKYFPQEITAGLMAEPAGGFEIVERENIEKVLAEQKLQLSDLFDESTSVGLGRLSGVEALMLGSVTRLASDIRLFAKLVGVEDAKLLGSKSVRIKVDPDIKALLGENLAVAPRSKLLSDDEELLLNTLAYLFEARISAADGKPAPLYLHQGRLYTEAGLGRPYHVLLHNKSDRDVGVALAIDGVNTIDRKITRPSAGAKWFVRKGAQGRIDGWYVSEKAVERFVFVEGGESLAASLGHTEEIGLLTAAFFDARPQR